MGIHLPFFELPSSHPFFCLLEDSFILCEEIRSNLWEKEPVKNFKNLNKCFAKSHNRTVTLKASACIRITWEIYLKCKSPFPSPNHWFWICEATWGFMFKSSGDRCSSTLKFENQSRSIYTFKCFQTDRMRL